MLEELDRLAALHAAGSLTDEEFASAKAKLLTQGPGTSNWRERLSSMRARKPLIAAAVIVLLVLGGGYALATSGPGEPPASSAEQLGDAATGEGPVGEGPPVAYTPEPAAEPEPVAPEPEPEPVAPDYSGDVTVLESGWGVTLDAGFANWGAVVKNNGDAWLQTNISAVASDAKGAPVDTSTDDVALPPHSTQVLAGTFMNPHGVRSVKVEAAPGFAQPNPLYTGDLTLTGKLSGTQAETRIVWTLKSGLDSTLKQGAEFFVVFRDKSGHIVGGGSDFVPLTLAPGQTKTFATNGGLAAAPDTAVRVQGWVDPTGFVAVS